MISLKENNDKSLGIYFHPLLNEIFKKFAKTFQSDEITRLPSLFFEIFSQLKNEYSQKQEKIRLYRTWCEHNYTRLYDIGENVILKLNDIFREEKDEQICKQGTPQTQSRLSSKIVNGQEINSAQKNQEKISLYKRPESYQNSITNLRQQNEGDCKKIKIPIFGKKLSVQYTDNEQFQNLRKQYFTQKEIENQKFKQILHPVQISENPKKIAIIKRNQNFQNVKLRSFSHQQAHSYEKYKQSLSNDQILKENYSQSLDQDYEKEKQQFLQSEETITTERYSRLTNLKKTVHSNNINDDDSNDQTFEKYEDKKISYEKRILQNQKNNSQITQSLNQTILNISENQNTSQNLSQDCKKNISFSEQSNINDESINNNINNRKYESKTYLQQKRNINKLYNYQQVQENNNIQNTSLISKNKKDSFNQVQTQTELNDFDLAHLLNNPNQKQNILAYDSSNQNSTLIPNFKVSQQFMRDFPKLEHLNVKNIEAMQKYNIKKGQLDLKDFEKLSSKIEIKKTEKYTHNNNKINESGLSNYQQKNNFRNFQYKQQQETQDGMVDKNEINHNQKQRQQEQDDLEEYLKDLLIQQPIKYNQQDIIDSNIKNKDVYNRYNFDKLEDVIYEEKENEFQMDQEELKQLKYILKNTQDIWGVYFMENFSYNKGERNKYDQKLEKQSVFRENSRPFQKLKKLNINTYRMEQSKQLNEKIHQLYNMEKQINEQQEIISPKDKQRFLNRIEKILKKNKTEGIKVQNTNNQDFNCIQKVNSELNTNKKINKKKKCKNLRSMSSPINSAFKSIQEENDFKQFFLPVINLQNKEQTNQQNQPENLQIYI
ncbi:hypothetical protein PPERSA_11345 [Pseudocohnilembus persalinus]|uniref:Uncharacterized protein n=1 Tax=Pseudocohnilembus persalinus TaxID=266149 RepID=A0A0V0QPU6_PSEPJ|nr:hypothetical protein PPERSA_11345 [Pseudocohnilembus persalinus]|eukprot:KRX04221.1 hypothetical protein PPERSA_11345 [Pseudocohnilembus persalinus]